jgi:hypothetical protein
MKRTLMLSAAAVAVSLSFSSAAYAGGPPGTPCADTWDRGADGLLNAGEHQRNVGDRAFAGQVLRNRQVNAGDGGERVNLTLNGAGQCRITELPSEDHNRDMDPMSPAGGGAP